jgi:HSP20 family protein
MTNLIRREPRRLMTLREAMDRLFEDALLRPYGEFELAPMATAPPVDVSKTDNEIIVTATVPGIKPEDLTITLSDNTLELRGEMKTESERSEAAYHLRERRMGSFRRTISLPAAVKTDATQAEFENGVLTLTMPKAEEARRRTITIKPTIKR